MTGQAPDKVDPPGQAHLLHIELDVSVPRGRLGCTLRPLQGRDNRFDENGPRKAFKQPGRLVISHELAHGAGIAEHQRADRAHRLHAVPGRGKAIARIFREQRSAASNGLN